jgi:NADPH:quinone reductase
MQIAAGEGDTMRAAYYENNGPAAEVLKVAEVDTPEPGPGEVRVKLKFSGVNPSDVKARAGSRKAMTPYVIPHSDGAGEVDAVGRDVPRSRLGERVWTWNGQWKRPFGTCAEYIVLPERQAVKLPSHVTFEAGACLGIPALTAWHAVEVAEAREGAVLLIAGGAGAVAHYAIQFAKTSGASVITTVSSADKARLAREAGADHTIDYKREDVGERVKALTGNRGVDAIIELDITANARLIPVVLRARGIVVVYGVGGPEATIPASFCLQNAITLKFIFVYELTEAERARAIAGITRLLEADRLVNNVAQSFALADIVAAHRAVEQGGALGNVVVKVG